MPDWVSRVGRCCGHGYWHSADFHRKCQRWNRIISMYVKWDQQLGSWHRLAYTCDSGQIPQIIWEPWSADKQDSYPLEAIAAGKFDTLITNELHVQFLSAIQEGGGMRHHHASHEPVHIWLHDQMTNLLSAAVAQGEATNLDVEFTAGAVSTMVSVWNFSVSGRWNSSRVIT